MKARDVLNENALLISVAEGGGRHIPFVEHRGTAACLCYDSTSHCVLLVRQERPVVGVRTLEIPSGLIEDGELPKVTAQRETLEESGYAALELSPLGTILSSVGMSNEAIHLFWTRDFVRSEGYAAELETAWIPLESAVEEVLHHGGDSKTVCALLLFLRQEG